MNAYNAFGAGTPVIPEEFVEIATVCTATNVVIGGLDVIGIADARALHAGLGVGRDYTNWIKGRIAKFGFQTGQDYEAIRSPELASTPRSGGQNAITYRVTLDMAKELAMVENNEIGRLVRRYFIWLEKSANHRLGQAVPAHEFDHWSNEELRTRRGVVDMYRQVLNNPSALWAMERMGFPLPPRQLQPEWRQSELWPVPSNSVTITVSPNQQN